jgi:hypothetical protein
MPAAVNVAPSPLCSGIGDALAIDQKVSLLRWRREAFSEWQLAIRTYGLQLEHAVAYCLDR